MAGADYMELMANLFDCFSEDAGPDEDWPLEFNLIMNQKAAIENIVGIVRELPMFTGCQDQYQEFISFLDGVEGPQERVKAAWYHILERSANAPTSMHLRGVVILCMPALKYALDRYISEAAQ